MRARFKAAVLAGVGVVLGAALYAQQPPPRRFEWLEDPPAASRPHGGQPGAPRGEAPSLPEAPPMEPPPAPAWWQTAYGLNKRGTKEFAKGDFEAAARRHAQALALKPDDETLAFNWGTALAGAGRSGEALKVLGEVVRATEGRPVRDSLRSAALYNAGGALAEGERWAEAVEAYREALRLRPDDAEAKRNYEIAMRKKKEQEENAQQNRDGEQDKDNEKQEGQDPQETPENQEGQTGENPSPDQLSQEEAERLLESLRQYEKEALEAQEEKKRRAAPARGAFDW